MGFVLRVGPLGQMVGQMMCPQTNWEDLGTLYHFVGSVNIYLPNHEIMTRNQELDVSD